MDLTAWVIAAVVLVATAAFVIAGPRLARHHRASQERGRLSGVVSGLDAVWRPSTDEARHEWEAAVEAPAPAPAPGDPGRIRGCRIVLRAGAASAEEFRTR